MASCLFSRGRLLVPRLSTVLRPQLCFKSESAKEAFRKIFPRMGAGKLKARYDANSYGQTVGPEYPFDIEKTPEGKLKREKSKGTMGSVTVEEIVDILRSNGGENIKLAKLHQDLHYADHFVIVSAKNTEHLKSMTQELASKLIAAHQGDAIHVEGLGSFDWMVVDAGQVVVHLFLQHIRDDYNIDEAWAEKEGSAV
ncbi:mitochondrial assembly of ribosomal large subunit protein 1-like [Rhopilema esculentum]|uniref:mitochondrial assembly of ribosomal large subunit protein 1-like n=1 Tax=Rhopilema esculentum TaxID=499914 RepID=UPI0031D4CD5B|eukprot:gene13841-4779_t